MSGRPKPSLHRGNGPFPTGLQFIELDESRKKQLFHYIAALMR